MMSSVIGYHKSVSNNSRKEVNTMSKRKMEVKVYMDSVNYLGEVTESTLIAEFLSMNWAYGFIEEAKKCETEIYHIRVVESK